MAYREVTKADGLRRWSFAECVFDESAWSLKVNGQYVHIEAKPLELLRELLLKAGQVVSKGELLHAIWPGVIVVEASLPTAVHKLRAAIGDEGRSRSIIETVSGIGYRLMANVSVEVVSRPDSNGVPTATVVRHPSSPFGLRWLGAGLATASVMFVLSFPSSTYSTNSQKPPPHSQEEAMNALRRLDVPAIERMLAAGWDPNVPMNSEGSGALHTVLEMCEWDPGHDQRRLMLVARTLHEGGARLDLRNIWGDTPYSIASAPRYCGPTHPATKALYAACFGGLQRVRDRCLASYQLTRKARQNSAQIPISKGR